MSFKNNWITHRCDVSKWPRALSVLANRTFSLTSLLTKYYPALSLEPKKYNVYTHIQRMISHFRKLIATMKAQWEKVTFLFYYFVVNNTPLQKFIARNFFTYINRLRPCYSGMSSYRSIVQAGWTHGPMRSGPLLDRQDHLTGCCNKAKNKQNELCYQINFLNWFLSKAKAEHN